MSFLDLLVLLVVAGICGSIGQAITGYSRGGCLGSIAIAFIGSLVGMWLANLLGLGEIFTLKGVKRGQSTLSPFCPVPRNGF